MSDRLNKPTTVAVRKAVHSAKFSLVQVGELLKLAIPAIAVAALALLVAFQFIDPPPPKQITIATGGETGAYYKFGGRYAEALRKSGIKVTVRASGGSIENLALLRDAKSGVDAAFVQGGLAGLDGANLSDLNSVGRMFYEPLWLFYRGPKLERIADFANHRIAVGPEGSGTRPLALQVLAVNKIGFNAGTHLPITGNDAAAALESGEIDAAFYVAAPEAPIIQRLLQSSAVRVLSFDQADAYSKILPFLSKVTLPRGVFDLVRDIPDRDIHLIAPATALVVRSDLHPAIVTLLAEAASDLHAKPGVFNISRQFPQPVDPEFEMSPEAERQYKNGTPFLRRYLPFNWAVFLERMAILAIPVLTVLVPLGKALPALYQWQIRRRLFGHYGRLKEIEAQARLVNTDGERALLVHEIDRIELAASSIPVPLGFAQQLYDLRSHIQFVRDRLSGTGGSAAAVI